MNRRLPPLNALRAFEAAGRHQSFTRAANELHVTHAAISHQIKALEGWLGIPLFQRLTRAVQLTDAGRTYLPVVESAFNQIHAGTATLSTVRGDAPLHVTTAQAFAVRWLAPRLRHLWDSHPDLDLRLHEHSWLEDVDFSSTEVDVAVRIGPQSPAGVRSVLLFPGNVTPMCSPLLLRDDVPVNSPSDLLHYKLLHGYDYHPWQAWFKNAGAADAAVAHGPVFDDTNLIYAAALSGQGIGLIHTALVREEIDAGQLVQLFPGKQCEDTGYYIHYRAVEADELRIARFRDWLLSEAVPTIS